VLKFLSCRGKPRRPKSPALWSNKIDTSQWGPVLFFRQSFHLVNGSSHSFIIPSLKLFWCMGRTSRTSSRCRSACAPSKMTGIREGHFATDKPETRHNAENNRRKNYIFDRVRDHRGNIFFATDSLFSSTKFVCPRLGSNNPFPRLNQAQSNDASSKLLVVFHPCHFSFTLCQQCPLIPADAPVPLGCKGVYRPVNAFVKSAFL